MSPKRKTGWVPALTHLKRRGMGRVRLPGRPDIYFGPVGVWPAQQKKPPRAVEEAYKKVVAEWLASGGQQAPAPAPCAEDNPTIREIVAPYVRHVERTYRKRGQPTSLYGQVKMAVKPLVTLYGDLPAAAFGPREWRAVRDALMRGDKLSGETIRLYGARLRSLFHWAAHEGMVPEETVAAITGTRWFGRGAKAPSRWKPKKPVPEKDFQAVLPHLPPAVRAVAQVQRYTGMRPEEVCYMRAGDITEEEDGLWAYTARDDANKLAHRGIPKVVLLGPQAQAVLVAHLKAARKKGADAWLFANTRGRPFTPHLYRLYVVEACASAGVPRWTPSRLRHTRGSETRRKYGPEGAQAELGHSHPKMTERYTSSILDELRRQIARESG